MRARLQDRLAALKQEYEEGARVLEDLDARSADVRATMLRLSGAIQVLEEELSGDTEAGSVGGA